MLTLKLAQAASTRFGSRCRFAGFAKLSRKTLGKNLNIYGVSNAQVTHCEKLTKGDDAMHFLGRWAAFFSILGLLAEPAASQQTIDNKVRNIKDALMVLCLAGGVETELSTQGDVELSAKIKDILTGNIGTDAAGKVKFTRNTWEGIIGGISKDMTAVQSEQANEARKCMREEGFNILNKAISQ